MHKELKAAVGTLSRHAFLPSQVLDLVPVPVVCCDRSGVIRYANASALSLLPMISPGQDFASQVTLGNHEGMILPWEDTPPARVIASGLRQQDIPVSLLRDDGLPVPLLLTAEPLFDARGNLNGAACYFQPAPEPSPATLPHGPDLHALLESLSIPAYTTDAGGRITFCNRAAAELCGYVPVPGVDRWSPFREICNAFGEPLSKDKGPSARCASGHPLPNHLREVIGECHDGRRVRVQPRVSLIRDADSRIAGAVTFLLEVHTPPETELHVARMSAIVTSSRDAIISKSLDGIIETWNAGATEIFGYQASEMIGQPVTRLIPPERQHEEMRILEKLRNNERIDHFETERVTKDGRRIQISLTVSPIRDNLGRVVGASKIARDISERKRAEEVQRRLIKELNHRVKNTLATIQSLANQTARLASSPQEFSESLGRRIVALSQTHDLLSRNAWRGASLESVVRQRVQADVPAGNRVEATGPGLLLEPQLALHLALVLEELAANARRHGALSRPGGELSVRWTIRSAKGAPHVVLRWEEKGGPAVAEKPTVGLGTTLIRRSLAAHDGEVALHYQPSGVVCEISFPLTTATQSPSKEAVRPAAPVHQQRVPANENAPRVLVVEDEAAIAFDLVSFLSDVGCEVVGPAASLSEALNLIGTGQFDIALLDANLAGQSVGQIAEVLESRSIPFAFLSGYGPTELPEGFASAPLVRKPFTFDQIAGIVHQLARRMEFQSRRNS